VPEESNQKKSSENKTTLIVIVVIVVLVILGGTGYLVQQSAAERSAEKAIEDATVGKVGISEGGKKVTVETNEGKLTVGEGQIPENFPSDVPIYSGVEVITSSESGGNFTLTLKSSDSVSKVSDFYKTNLANKGWTLGNPVDFSGSTAITATKNGRELNVVITPDNDGKTAIAIVINKS